MLGGELSWEKENDHLLRFALLAFDAKGQLIMVAASGESAARSFRTPVPRIADIPGVCYYAGIIYDEQWIPVSCGVMSYDSCR